MKLLINLELDNAAFADGGPAEVERILTDLALRLPDPLAETNGELLLLDLNGNFCGTALIE